MYYRYKDIKILEKLKSKYSFLNKVNLFLTRHGESEGNVIQNRVINEQVNIPPEERIADYRLKLTSKGEIQAKELGKKINNLIKKGSLDKNKTLVLVSPYERTRKTFEIANEIIQFDLKKVHVLNSLREQSFGAFDFVSRTRKKSEFPKEYAEYSRNDLHFYRQQYLGESPADVCDRLYSVLFFLKEYLEREKDENIFIFGHGCANRCLIMDIFNLPPEFYDDFQINDNCSIISIEKGNWKGVIS